LTEKPRVGVLENGPPWWPNWKEPEFTEEDLCEIERYCKKIVENVSKEKGMTPRERLKTTLELGIPDRPLVYSGILNVAVARVLDCWSDSLKPGIDMWWYPKLCLKAHLAWVARFNTDFPWPYIFSYGETEWGGSSRAKLLPYAAMAGIDPPIKTEEDWDIIHVPDPNRDGYYPVNIWLVRKTKEFMNKHGVSDVMPLHGAFCPSSVDVANHIIGLKRFFAALKREPEAVHRVAKMDLPFRIKYAKAMLEAGADFLMCCSFGGVAGIETYKQFDKWNIEVVKRVGASNFLWGFGFDQSPTLEYMCETGSMPMGWTGGYETPIELARRVATKYNKVFTNTFDALIAVHGPPDKIVETVKKNITVGAGPGYMFSAPVADYWIPQEHNDLVVKTAKEYGREVYKGLK
jgi:uroporphyrinogen-III decarboxylase